MNHRVTSKKPSIVAIRNRTTDRAACHHETKALRELKYENPLADKLPTHIGIKRFFTPESMSFLRSAVRMGIGTEREHMRLPMVQKGEYNPIVLASSIHLDVLLSRRIDPKYAQGLIDALRMQRLSVENSRTDTPPPSPVLANVAKLNYTEKGEVKMVLESEELREERSRMAEYLGKNGVKAYTYVKDEDPLEVIIARNRVEDYLSARQATDLVDGIHSAMDRLQANTATPGIVLELQPWKFTKGVDSAIAI